MDPTSRSLLPLGWPTILGALADRCRLPSGRARALALPFLETAAEVEAALATVEEARALAEARITLPFGGAGPAESHVDRVAKGGVLEPMALRECAALLRAAARTRALLVGRAGQAPRLAAIAVPLSEDVRLADRIESAIEPSGEIADRASPELGPLRERSRGLHRALKAHVESLLADELTQRKLRDTYFTIRNDRYVLPVLASARSELPGIIHNASQSGQTLFIEPESMLEMGNELSIATAMIAEEEARVLRELSEALSRRAADLAGDIAVLARLDQLEASAALASELDAHAPAISAAGEGLALRSLRHPILALQKKKVVASDVRLLPPARALIVSGPNGGGKTVTITAVGLAACMLRAGLPVAAAEGSRLPLFAQVFAAVEERGDLARDLSTFTAHLSAIRDIAASAGPRALVLVDEIAADTDPREGAALASAILETFVDGGAHVLVTTHLDELKALALSDPRFANARVGFDAEKLVPTYQLHLGSPGSSSAIEVAARMGLAPAIVERARAALHGQGGALSQALRALDDERAKIAAERKALEAERERARRAADDAEKRSDAARRAEKEAAARLGAELADEVESARYEVAELLASLQAKPTVKQVTEAAAKLDGWRAQVSQAAKAADAQAKAGPEAQPGAALARGARVRVVSLGHEGEVIELGDGDALVRVGSLKTRRPLRDLLPLKGKAAAPVLARGRAERMDAAGEAKAAAVELPDRRLDARGLRVEELLRAVDGFLDRLYAEGALDCVVLHGHGTGALKAALRAHLSASAYVGTFRAGDRHEGGDAVTVVTLRR